MPRAKKPATPADTRQLKKMEAHGAAYGMGVTRLTDIAKSMSEKLTPADKKAIATQTMTPKPVSTLAADADATVHGPRQDDYGDKLQNFTQIAMLFQGVLATKLLPGAAITPEDVTLLMMQVKIARLAKSPDHKDSILDVAGYSICYNELQLQRIAGYKLRGATIDPRAGVYKTQAG